MAWHARFSMQCDCVEVLGDQDEAQKRVALGLSNLEGNVWDGCVKILDSATGQEQCSVQCASSMATLAAVSQGRILAVGADDGVISLLSAQDLSPVASFYAHDNIVARVASYNDDTLLSAGWDGAMHLWGFGEAGTPTALVAFENAHTGFISDCAVSPHSPHVLASVGRDGFLRMWDARDGNACTDILDLGDAGSCLAFDLGDATSLAVGSEAGTVMLVDVRKLANEANTNKVGWQHEARVRRIRSVPPSASAAAGSTWVSVSDDTTTAIFSSSSLLAGSSAVVRLTSHTDYVADVALLTHATATVAQAHDSTFLQVFSASTDCSLACQSHPLLL